MELAAAEKLTRIVEDHPRLSIRRQCELLGLNRSNWYYEPKEVDPYNLELMNLIDEEYTRHPFYGSPRMTVYLNRLGHQVNHKRVARLMREMGIEGIRPKKNLSKAQVGHKIYPYLLRDLEVAKPNQVWTADITYIRLAQGFIYLVAVMDWYSRYVLSFKISNTLTADFCVEALEDALRKGVPEISNTDQGSQFTSDEYTRMLIERGIKISMDSKGRAFDNIFIERLWRNVKYEEVYLKQYRTVTEAKIQLGRYFEFYNQERPHQSLCYKTPAEIYFGERKPMDMWTSPADQPEPFGTCGQTDGQLFELPTACPHSLASRPQIHRLNSNIF